MGAWFKAYAHAFTHLLHLLLFFFFFFMAPPAAYGSSQARRRIGVAAGAYVTGTAAPDPNHICNLQLSQLDGFLTH